MREGGASLEKYLDGGMVEAELLENNRPFLCVFLYTRDSENIKYLEQSRS